MSTIKREAQSLGSLTLLRDTVQLKDKRKEDKTLTDLPEEGAVEGHSEEAVDSPHANIQIHQEPLLLQSVDCGANPLQ